jgi:hypothetical protein
MGKPESVASDVLGRTHPEWCGVVLPLVTSDNDLVPYASRGLRGRLRFSKDGLPEEAWDEYPSVIRIAVVATGAVEPKSLDADYRPNRFRRSGGHDRLHSHHGPVRGGVRDGDLHEPQ